MKNRLSYSPSAEKLSPIGLAANLAQRYKMLSAFVVLLGAAGCQGKETPPAPDACEISNLQCGDNGMCVLDENDEAVCGCDEGHAGDDCGTCAEGYAEDSAGECSPDATQEFSPENFLAYGVFGPDDSGTIEVSGKTGGQARYNGYKYEIQKGSFSEPTYVILGQAVGANVVPDSDGVLQSASGVNVFAVPVGNEFKDIKPGDEIAEFNEVQPLKDNKLLFAGYRGTVAFHNEIANQLEFDTPFSMTMEGTQGDIDHHSVYYTVDHPVQMNSAVTQGTPMGEFFIDFDGTTDEGTDELLEYDLDTTAGTIAKVSDKVYKFNLPVGQHSVKAIVKNQFGEAISDVTYNIDVAAPVLLDRLEMNCAPSEITPDESADCDATAYWSPGTDTPVDTDGAWSTNDGSVDADGVFMPDAAFAGTAEVGFEYGGQNTQANVNVVAVITDVTVTCNDPSVQVGQQTECDAVATWNDGVTTPEDDECTWGADLGTVDSLGGYTAPSTAEISTSPTTDTVECDLGVDGIGEYDVEVTAAAPSAWNLDAGCGGQLCSPGSTFTGSFEYSGDITDVEGWCTITGGSIPGTITDITFNENGGGTFTYNSSNQGSEIETLHIKLYGPNGITETTFDIFTF